MKTLTFEMIQIGLYQVLDKKQDEEGAATQVKHLDTYRSTAKIHSILDAELLRVTF